MPQLAPLGDYGGPTLTMPPLLSASSPVVNAAITIAGSPTTDQRGIPRIFASFPDIGAAELGGYVSTLADSGAGSLRDTIANASPGDTITFEPSLSGMTITLAGTKLPIEKDLTIDASALPGGITIDANNASGVIHIASGNVVTLDSLTITGGNTGSFGGGIDVIHSSLTLQNSTITGNTAALGGGIFTRTDLAGVTTTLTNCTITNNSATSFGGGIYNDAGKTVLTHCTITDNTAPAGAGSGVASHGHAQTETEVFASIISGNTNSDIDFVMAATNSFTSNDANLIGTGNAIGDFSQPKDQVGITNHQLAPLANYGGPTQTMPPLTDSSPAFNAAITIAGSPSTDQRGLPRISGSIPDIGAAELQTLVVTTLADSGAGSLRDTISNATAGSSITFDPSLSGMTITLGGTELFIDKDLTIDASTLPSGITIDANNASRVIDITSGNVVTLDSLTITGGNASGGGGILSDRGTLNLTACTLSYNHSDDGGGGIYINNLGSGNATLSLTSCTFAKNSTDTYGGAIRIEAGLLTINSSTISGNTALTNGGGILVGGGTMLSLTNTIVAGNSSPYSLDIRNFGTTTRSGGNIIGDNTLLTSVFPAGSPNGNGDYVGTSASPLDPLLAPLGNYGGPTQTMPLLPGSPAIEGAILLGGTPPTDQHGNPRPSGPLPDIGAVEALPISLLSLASTDGDNIPDILEGPGNAYPHLSPSVDDSAVDTDGDGSTDAEEIANMTDPLDASSRFRVLSMPTAVGFDPVTNPVFEITINTFPGLSYRLETSDTLTGFTLLPGSQFTATGFSQQLSITLGANSDFVRAQRD